MGDLYPVMKIENGLFQKSSKVYENTCQLFFYTHRVHFSLYKVGWLTYPRIWNASDLGPNCLGTYLGTNT